jgi:hypothetical protein
MADLNALIAQGYQFQPPSDPFVQYGRMQQLEQGQQANQLNRMKMQEYQRSMEETNALRRLDPASPTYLQEVTKLNPKLGFEFAKSQREAANAQTEGQLKSTKLVADKLALLPDAYRMADTPEAYLAVHKSVHADPVLGPYLQSLGATPEKGLAQLSEAVQTGKFDQFRMRSMQSVSQLLDSIKPVVVGASSSVYDPTKGTFNQAPAAPVAPSLSTLAKLQAEMAALPPDDPRRSAYSAAIAKESQFAPLAPPSPSTLAKLQNEMAELPPGDPRRATYAAMIRKEINFAPSNAGQGKPPAGYRYDSSGENLEVIPGGPADKQEKLKPIPPQINTAIITNQQSIQKLEDGLQLLKNNPDAVGIKGGLPQYIVNRTNPEGIPVRAAIADIGSLVLHDRSGAAVTASEEPRLLPFIPTPSDTAESAKTKLTRMLKYAREQQEALKGTYSQDQGYKTNPILGAGNPPARAGVSAITAADAILAKMNQGRR